MITEKILKKHDIHPLLQERWSPRMFSDQTVMESEIQLLLEAGRWAPSSNNLQPWRIIWGAKGSKTYDRIFECLDSFNQKWAGNAPVLMLGAFKKTNAKDKENFHALHDLGAFSAHLTFQAQSMGLAVHQMAGVKHEKAHAEFKFTEDYHVATALAIGYYGGDRSDLPEDLEKIETPTSERTPRKDFAFNGDFKETKNTSEENK
ncbi:nitroreductase family protein [Altibacter sp.]|uniref:nitroreductase family protein n=1 Tax=Altibacter sp. TaxID=2024823 RepID=UPI000C97A607|nr:nitroreductase family protein [Altibacter sp.]MAP54958.1 nitroreductase [Altibacter sp.]